MLKIINEHNNIFVAIQSVDFRKGIDGLASYCRETLMQNPLSGHVWFSCHSVDTLMRNTRIPEDPKIAFEKEIQFL